MKIYYAKICEYTEAELQYAMQLLPKARIDKMERSRQKKSQAQSLAAGLLLEYGLRQLGLSGKELTFLENADGKPYVKEYPNLCYNLSHSGEYVALVLDETPVGIDVEGLRRGYQKLVRRFFSKEEIAVLEETWSDEFFTKLWTRKESYLKATGYGMRMPLEGFSTLEDMVQVNTEMYEEMVEPKAKYYLASFLLDEDYWLSVCRKNEPILTGLVFPEKVDLKKSLIKV